MSFLKDFSQNESQERSGRCVAPSRNRAPRLIRKNLLIQRTFFTHLWLPVDILIAKKVSYSQCRNELIEVKIGAKEGLRLLKEALVEEMKIR